jgi:hypothetical protein
MNEEPLELPEPTIKPAVRRRDNLTTIQITDDQKGVIDQAYQIFHNGNAQHLTKGQFLTLVAMDYIRNNSVQ